MPESKAPQPPERIWLQIEGHLSEYEFTHCADKINNDDVEYIRTTASYSALKEVGLCRIESLQNIKEDRKEYLARAMVEFLLNNPVALEMVSIWDGVECDGHCLVDDIKAEFCLEG